MRTVAFLVCFAILAGCSAQKPEAPGAPAATGPSASPAPVEAPAAAPAAPAEPAPAAATAPRSFDHKPLPGEKATCPVMGDAFTVTESTQMSEHGGRWYAFCCPGCKPKFDADPARYADKT